MIMVTEVKLHEHDQVWNRYWDITVHMDYESPALTNDDIKKQMLETLLKDVLDLSIDDIKEKLPEHFI